MILIPKRKLTLTDNSDTANYLLDHAVSITMDNIQTLPNVIDDLHVRNRLKIPVGTDKYD